MSFLKNILKIALDLSLIVRHVVVHRRLVAWVSEYALSSMVACRLVEKMRERYPGHNFIWSYPTNHVLNARCFNVVLWRVMPDLSTEFLYGGNLKILSSKVDSGLFDAVMRDVGSERPDGGCQCSIDE